MRKSKFTEEEIAGVLKEIESLSCRCRHGRHSSDQDQDQRPANWATGD